MEAVSQRAPGAGPDVKVGGHTEYWHSLCSIHSAPHLVGQLMYSVGAHLKELSPPGLASRFSSLLVFEYIVDSYYSI